MAPMLSILAATSAVIVGGASADPAPGKYFDKVLIMMFENVRSVCRALNHALQQLADSRRRHLFCSTPKVR